MGVISWLVFGAIVGWLASMIAGASVVQGWLANIVIGIVGAFIGGLLYSLITEDGFDFGWSISSFVVAVIGALFLLTELRPLRRA